MADYAGAELNTLALKCARGEGSHCSVCVCVLWSLIECRGGKERKGGRFSVLTQQVSMEKKGLGEGGEMLIILCSHILPDMLDTY